MNKGVDYSQKFLNSAKTIHGDRYDYSKVIYVNAHTKVEIICREHGSFFQAPLNHADKKKGCYLCYLKKLKEKYKKPEVIKEVLPVYKRNKAKRDHELDTYNRKILLWAKKYKLIQEFGGSCRCGVDSIWAMCFHHVNGDDKKYTLTKLLCSKARFKDLLKEALKCHLLCQNCHREEHFDRSAQSLLNKKLCLEYKGKYSCGVCGYNKCLDALEFHHKFGKKFKISHLTTVKKWKVLGDLNTEVRSELDKCQVLCRNCHQIEHTDINFFLLNKDVIIEKSKQLKDKNSIDINAVILLNNKRFNRFEIAKKLSCSPGRVYEILKSIGGNHENMCNTNGSNTLPT